MSLLTEQEIKDLLIPLFIRQDQASIHWPDIFEEVALIETAVIEKIKAQGPAMLYNGRCIVDCGEYGHPDVELLKLIPGGTNLYRLPEGG